MINVFSRNEMIEYGYRPNEYYISILPTGGPKGEPIFRPASNVLTLVFDDVEKDCIKSTYPDGNGLRFAKAMSVAQAKQVAAFIKKLPKDYTLNINCVHGVSRSAAMAAAIDNTKNPQAGNKLVYDLVKREMNGIS